LAHFANLFVVDLWKDRHRLVPVCNKPVPEQARAGWVRKPGRDIHAGVTTVGSG
jgi:hypothetical protein